MPVPDYSVTPASNVSISGINVGEGCPAGNINGAFRQMMADVRVMYNGLPVTADLMGKAGGTFTGDILRSGRGGYLHYATAGMTGGQVFVQPLATALPSSPAEGTLVFQY